jgi:hypothetical protein
MHGPGLAALFADIATGGSGKTEVLKAQPSGNELVASDVTKHDALQKLLKGK